jgi:predicted nucleotidyltransferase
MPERELFPQHERLIARATERFRADPATLAVIVGGSVAHGVARPDSDVDLMLLVPDEELERRGEALTFADDELADYEGGYVDVKLVSPGFLAEVAERGSEPARWAFTDAFPVWSQVPELDGMLDAASAYPEHERDEKLAQFVKHLVLAAWFLREAAKRADPYLTTYAASKVTLYAGRAVLAYNRLLFPFHKWFMHELRRAPEQPAELLPLIETLLREPRHEDAQRLVETVQQFTGLQPTIRECADAFLLRTEWSWRGGLAPLDES